MPLTPQEREYYRSRFNHAAVVVIQGELIELSHVKLNKAPRLPGKRGLIKGFTPSARLRMLRTLATVDWNDVPDSLFITLTYPDSRLRGTPKHRSRDRYLFHRSMENYLGRKVGALWRVEWIDRKSGEFEGSWQAHVHLIVFDCKFIPWQKVRSWWRAALAVDGPLSTTIERIEGGGKKAAYYVSKYCGKKQPDLSLDIASYLNTGRAWGITRKELVPVHQRIVHRITDPRELQLLENGAAMTFPYFIRGVDEGFSLFGKNAVRIIDEILRTDLDKWICPE